MLRGLRAADAPLIQRLCGAEGRLFLRLGALLQAQVTITQMALEAALADANGKLLLSDRRLKDVQPAGFTALAAEHGAAALGLVLVDGATGAEAGWRVIALEDELGNPLLQATVETNPDPSVAPAIGEMIATLTPALRTPVEGLLSARADDQRAAALEQLRYAAPPLAVVSELMPMLLADAAELVRERAIGLLVAAGAHVAVVDLVRALHRRDDAAIMRCGEVIATLPTVQQDLAVSALSASAARGQATQTLVELGQRLARHLSDHRGLDRLLEQLLPTRLSLLGLVRALQDHDAPRVESILRRNLGHGTEQDATIIMLLAAPGQTGDDALVARGVELLLASGEEPRERMVLAGALRRLDPDGGRLVRLITARGMGIASAHDTSVYWLIAELCRDRAIPPALAEELAGVVRRLLRDAPGPHLVALLEQQLPALLPASDAARGALVEPLVEVVARFRDDRSLDLVAACLSGIGTAATAALWLLLEEHPHETVRLLAADLLPQLISEPVAARAAARRLLGGLDRAVQGRERGALVTAAARLAASAALPAEDCAAIDRATDGLGEAAIDAFGHLAAAPGCAPERREAIMHQLIDELTEELPDKPVEQVKDPATDETTFVLDASLGAHTHNVPRVLTALHRIGCSPHLSADALQHLVTAMCAQWRKVASWQTIWGPANIQELGRVLGLLAGRNGFPGPLRVRICEALLPRLNQLTIARSLARVFVAAEGSYLSALAGKAGDRLVQLTSDGYYAEDELPELVEVLVDFLVIPHLGPQGDAVRRRIINLLLANRTHCTSRARAKLRALLPDLNADLQARLDWL